MTVAVLAVVFADHRTYYSDAWVRSPTPTRAIQRLAHAPPAPAVHIQPTGFLAGPAETPCFRQMDHGHPLVNVCGVVPPPEWSWQLGIKPLCQALRLFHDRGLRYVIADHMEDDPVPACMRPRYVDRAQLIDDDGKVRVWALSPAG